MRFEKNAGGNWNTGMRWDNKYVIAKEANEYFIIDDATGSVGIGTTEAVNSKLDVNGNIRIRGTGTSLPAADASYRGVMYLLQGSGGQPDKLYLCMMKSDASYQWVLIARGD